MRKRREKVKEKIKEKNVEAFLVSHLPNIRYLCGFTGSAGILLLLSDETHFFTDFRYQEQSKYEVDPEVNTHITNDPWKDLSEILKPIEKLGFESEYLTYLNLNKLKEKVNWIELVPTEGLVIEQRAIKDESEIELIRHAQSISDSVFKKVLDIFEPGKFTERDIANEMEYQMKKLGAEGTSFATIVASGAHSALPHAQPRMVKVHNETILLLDFGAKFDGYASDMTRTVWIGKNPDPRFIEIYEIVKEAVEKAALSAKPGMSGVEIDALARDHISSKGFGKYFGHSLGHGVGLEVHEKPILSPRSKNIVQKNTVFTIEPGIYLPEFGGVRIEELAVMRQDGAEILTSSPRDLILV